MNARKLTVALVLAALATVALVSLNGCPQPAPNDTSAIVPDEQTPPVEAAGGAQKIVQLGSTTVLPIAEKWRVAFNELHPEVDMAVSGGGSGSGIEALVSGTCDIADSSRPMKDKERAAAQEAGFEPVEHTVAYDGIAVIVNPDNPVTSLSFQQLSDLFVGDITDWDAVDASGLGDIALISRDSASGTYEAFKEIVLTLHNKDKERDYSPAALKQASNQAVLALVAQTKSAIGYVGLGYVNDRVKTVAIAPLDGGDAVEPTVANVKSGAYPISRSLFMYTRGEPDGIIKQYFEWGLGADGQALVADMGFVPLGE